jgi:enamine deaminase RidA (YjgF/YER057c/UK114 family)
MQIMSPEDNLAKLGITLPEVPEPKAIYKPCLVNGRHLYVSGHVPMRADFTRIKGKVGADMDVDEAKQMARLVGLLILSSIRKKLGSLNKVKRVIKVLGFVNADPDFEKQIEEKGLDELFYKVEMPLAKVLARLFEPSHSNFVGDANRGNAGTAHRKVFFQWNQLFASE